MMQSPNRLDGRVALVTGGSTGIGLASARRLAQAGAKVALIARDGPRLDAALAALTDEGHVALAFPTDVTDGAAVGDVVGRVADLWKPIDILLANAGGAAANVAVQDLGVAEWHACVDVNLTAVFVSVRTVLPGMLDARWGRIVTISSRAAVGGGVLRDAGPRATQYAAAKGGVLSFTQAVAVEVAGSGVTANVVAPGPIATEQFVAKRGAAALRAAAAKIPVGRLGEADDVAHAVLYLASDAGFTTGQVIHVNGGTWIG